jgi:hypothetical protein
MQVKRLLNTRLARGSRSKETAVAKPLLPFPGTAAFLLALSLADPPWRIALFPLSPLCPLCPFYPAYIPQDITSKEPIET